MLLNIDKLVIKMMITFENSLDEGVAEPDPVYLQQFI